MTDERAESDGASSLPHGASGKVVRPAHRKGAREGGSQKRGLRPGVKRYARVRRGERLVARSLFCFLLALYVLVATGLPDHMDSEIEFQTTSALGRGQGLALGGTPESDALVAARKAMPDSLRIQLMVGRGHERYADYATAPTFSWFGTGQALGGGPFYWVGRLVGSIAPEVEQRFGERTLEGVPRSEYYAHLFVGLRNPLCGALTAWLIVLCAARLGLARSTAFLAGLTYGVTTFALPQARSTLSDVQATTCLFGAFYLILTVREALERGLQPRSRHVIGAGALLALAFLTRLVSAPAVAVLALAMLAVLLRGHKQSLVRDQAGGEPPFLIRNLVAFGLSAGSGLLLFFAFNYARFGDVMETGYGDMVADGIFVYPPLLGLAGVLLAPGKGLVFLASGLLIAPLGLLRVEGSVARIFVWTTLAMVLAVFGPIVGTETWHGAWTYGPRYLLPVLPFLWLAVAVAYERMRAGPRFRVLVAGLMLFGLTTSSAGVLVDHMTHQNLAMESAKLDWPDVAGGDDDRFQIIQWDARYAAPWAHWRILRHRLAGQGERYSSAELFYTDFDAELVPNQELRPGFRHLGWVDHASLGGRSWPLLLAILGLLLLGLRSLVEARDH